MVSKIGVRQRVGGTNETNKLSKGWACFYRWQQLNGALLSPIILFAHVQ